MKTSSETPSQSSHNTRSKKPNLRSSKSLFKDPIELTTKTPEKSLEKPPPMRTRNRGVALSISDIRKVAKGLQDQKKQSNETTSLKGKSARRQITLASPRKSSESSNLPEKYENLGEFFDSLDSSIRLLRLKGSMTSFNNIRPKIETLTDRRFTHAHLAQLKFILPEAIAIKKLLVFDERTSCMKPDLHVSINPDAVEFNAKLLSESGTMSLRKLFRVRLNEFWKSHPEGDEVPEEMLPEPFSRPKQDPLVHMMKPPSSFPAVKLSVARASSDIADNTDPANSESHVSVPAETSVEALNQKPAVASHMPQSFRRRFSQKLKENVQPLQSDSFQPSVVPVSESSLRINSTSEVPKISPPEFVVESSSSEAHPAIHDCFTPSRVTLATPSKTIEYAESKDGSFKTVDAMSTPAKFVSTPARLMSATPALKPPKRSFMTPDDNSTSSPDKLVKRPPRSRSLKFDTPMKNENDAGGLSIDDDIFDILPDNLLHSIQEKERIAMEERDPAISQAKKRKKIIASLPKLFNMIHMMFHSINRSVITKEELMSKIISSHRDIVDRSEVEEQLHLLLELVPEWISEKAASSGDMLVSVNKMLNPESLRASLEEAK
ncbi:DNA replication factor CDT1-like protein [Medicago truncatula]|uniref:DNA replication factor CDT1-like protein n=1 Tax=Medicago truncatula TaxID=3880 RepID=A0A072VLQ6_MEDTR|nr:DNA replication factor CDT1-like protein [Medicago truncatula]